MNAKNRKNRKPQDHRPKKDALIWVKIDGFSFGVKPGIFEEYEMLEALAGVEEENPAALPKLLKILVDNSTTTLEKVKAHIREKTGGLKTEAVAEFIKNVFEAVQEQHPDF